MHTHHLARAVRAAALGLFIVSIQTYAQSYILPTPLGATASSATSSATTTSISSGGTFTVTANDLRGAGWSEPQAAPPTEAVPAVSYFRVKETVASHPEWGSAANLVAVTIAAVSDPSWQYNAGKMELLELAGRTQVRLSRPGYYIVVTGPGAKEVVALANILRSK